jgi:hypothetical protein
MNSGQREHPKQVSRESILDNFEKINPLYLELYLNRRKNNNR